RADNAEQRVGIEHRPQCGELAHAVRDQELWSSRRQRAGGHRQGADQAVAREYARAVVIARALRQRSVLNRYQNADVAGRRVHGAEKSDGNEQPDLFEGGKREAGCDHQDGAGDQQTAQVVTRRNDTDRERQNGGTEQSSRRKESDLRGIESNPGQIDRKHDGGKTIAETAQCACGIEKEGAGTWIQRIAFILVLVAIERRKWRGDSARSIVEFIVTDWICPSALPDLPSAGCHAATTPIRAISHSRLTPEWASTLRRTASPSCSISAAVALPRLIRKLQCISDTCAPPLFNPRQPAASINSQALRLGGVLKVEPPVRLFTRLVHSRASVVFFISS